jgi:hypothetical protein
MQKAARLISGVEAVEKVPKQIFGSDVEKNDLTECATINDLMLGRVRADHRRDCSHWSKGLFLQAR